MNADANAGQAVGFRNGELTTTGAPHAPAAGESHGTGALPLPVIIATLKRQKWLIAGLGLAGLLVGLLIFLATDPVYQSSAQIEVNPETQKAVELDGQQSQAVQIDETYLTTQEQLLRTRALRERVARKLKLDMAPEIAGAASTPKLKLDAAVRWLGSQATISNLNRTRIFAIDVQSDDPQLATRVANTYVDEFINLNIERQLDTNAYARDYLSDQITKTRENLEKSERALVEYARQQEIVTLASVENGDAGQSLATKSLTDLNTALVGARARRIAAQERLRNDARQSTATPGDAALRTQLAQLRAEYRQKRDLFKPDYPEMVALQQQIDSLQASLSSSASQDNGAARRALEAEYKAALGEEKQLEAQVSQFKSTALDERGNSIQYNILKRDVDTNAAQYDALLERYKQLGPAGSQVQNLISVVDPATVPRSPIRPILPVNLALGMIAGLIVGIVIALLSSLLSSKVRAQRDVDQLLGQQFIGAVPYGEEFQNMALELNDPKAPIYEAFVSIANRLRFVTGEGFPKVLSLTSTMPNEGKSSTAYGMAHILTRQGKRVLLVDADLRMPTFLDFEKGEHMPTAREQSVGNEGRGLSEVLIGDSAFDDVLIHLTEKLDLMPSGETPPNPAELLMGEHFQQMLIDKAREYDHVIVDAPPVLGLADAPIIAALVNGTVFVVQSNRATSQQIRNAVRRIQENSGQVLGVVLTQTASEAAHDDYGYSYSYHYSYGGAKKQAEAAGGGLGRVLRNLRR